jgi:hypothetical protein
MRPSVLGKITTSTDRPRGPDVEMQLSIPEDWIHGGATLELELPRNLACAVCKGGGCDSCDRSGAVSLRGRKDPIELVEVTLPRGGESPGAASFVLRLPDRGGLPPEGSELPRGNLLLSIRPGPAPERGVVRLPGPSIPPGKIPEVLDTGVPARQPPGPLVLAALVVAIVALAWIVVRLLAN